MPDSRSAENPEPRRHSRQWEYGPLFAVWSKWSNGWRFTNHGYIWVLCAGPLKVWLQR